MDWPSDGQTDRWTKPLIEMRNINEKFDSDQSENQQKELISHAIFNTVRQGGSGHWR